jgi:isoleucyl-tRNA synthetase
VERGVRAFEQDVLDELNVEHLEIVASLDDRVAVSAELDMRDTSTLPPNTIPALRAALAARTGLTIRDALLASGHVTLPVGNIDVTLGWGDLKLRADGRDGFAAAVDRDVSVALDTAMTPHLRRKALARHLVHQIQMMRREARLNPEDRIRITVDAHGEVVEAVEEHRTYICTETLAVELRRGTPPTDWMAREADLEAARVNVAMTRA